MLANVLSIVAIVVSIGSLSWQVVSWRQGGAVITVAVAQYLSTSVKSADDWYVEITAANKGRSAVTVNDWGFKLRDGRRMAHSYAAPWSASCPHRLEPGASASWYMPTDVVVASCADQEARYQDLIAWVRLGDGREITARKRGIGNAGRVPVISRRNSVSDADETDSPDPGTALGESTTG